MISVDDPQTVHREKWLKDALEAIRANDWKSKNKKNVEAFSALTDKLVVAEDEAHFRDQVFKYLHFPEQDDRLHSISKPDENSFDWIFDERRQKEGSFIEWLGGTSGQNVFWMTGMDFTIVHKTNALTTSRKSRIREKHPHEVFIPQRRPLPTPRTMVWPVTRYLDRLLSMELRQGTSENNNRSSAYTHL